MFNGVFVIGFATLSSVLNIIVGDATTPLQSRADTLAMTRGRLCKFPLPLLCLYNGFSFYCGRTSGTTHARHNSFSPHSFCSSSSLAPPVQMHLRPRRTERERGRADTAPTDRRSGDGHVDDCCAQINGIVAALCNIQNQSKGEINDLCRRGAGGPPRLIHKHKAHGQEERSPPLYAAPCCSVDLITATLPPANLTFISFYEE